MANIRRQLSEVSFPFILSKQSPGNTVITQPAPSVSNEDVERIVVRDFPADVARVLTILHEYGTGERHREVDRVRLAVLKIAGGSIDGLHSAIETAKLDYRDVLAIAAIRNTFEQ